MKHMHRINRFTLALGAAMRNTGRLYAFDTSAHRLEALKPRLARSKLSNVHPAAIAHERDDRIKRLAGKIDRVIVDAPCSGLGTLRRNPDLKWRQSPQAVAELTAKQQAIDLGKHCRGLRVANVVGAARPGCSSPAGGWSMPRAACCARKTRPSPRRSAPKCPRSNPCRWPVPWST